jgi:PTH2 family peptidyl-tRNA hydrolase
MPAGEQPKDAEARQVKQYLVIRKDLELSAGKIAAQCAHAALKVFLDKFQDDDIPYKYTVLLTEEEGLWMDGLFTKIVKYVKSEADLLKVYEKAKAAGLNVSLIKDMALTELKEPAYTAVAIGPNYVDKIEPIVKRLQNL